MTSKFRGEVSSGMVRSLYKFISVREKAMKAVFMIASILSVFALLLIVVFLLGRGIPAIHRIGFFRFIFGTKWHDGPDVSPENQRFGILPMIVGTLYMTAISILIGVTIGLFTAIFLYKFCPKKLAAVIRQFINILAGIPSVVFGLFGLYVIGPVLQKTFGSDQSQGVLLASIILAIMILPTIVSITLDALHAVPKSNFEGALALGAGKERATFSVMLPAAKSGVFAAVVLAVGRVIGETMAVMMLIGGSPQMPDGSLFQSISTLTTNIATGAMESSPGTLDAKIATGVVLLIFTIIINVGFSLLKNRNKDKKIIKSKKSKVTPALAAAIDGNTGALPLDGKESILEAAYINQDNVLAAEKETGQDKKTTGEET